MLRLILGPAGSGKTATITEEIRTAVSDCRGEIYLLVPEQYSHEAERELCTVCGDALSLYAEVLSFSRLALRVFQEMGTGGKTALDKGGRLLCLSLALNQIYPALRLYPAARHKAELQTELLSAITELKAANISPEALFVSAAAASPHLADKLYDLALCMEGYEAILAQGRADPTDRLLRLSQVIGDSSLGLGGHFYLDGFTDFTGAELQVIFALMKKNAPLTVCLSCDSLSGTSEHFAPARKTANTLLRCAEELGLETEIVELSTAPQKVPALRYFSERLYHYSSEILEDEEGRIQLYRAESLRDECELAAALALDFLRETGCRYRDIAIAVRGFDRYAPALEEAFRLYGLPLFTARRGSILQKPVPALLSAAFEILLGGWDTDAVLRYLKTGLSGLSQEDCDLLEDYAVRWSIKGYRWLQAAPWAMHPEGFGRAHTEETEARLAQINALRDSLVCPLKHLAERGRQAETAGEQARALSLFLEEIQLPQSLQAKAEELEAAERPLLAAEYVQLWELIVSCVEQTEAILGASPMTQEQFSKLFLQTLSQYDVSAIPVALDRISAGEMDRMRRRHIKHLIVLGASDENLPHMENFFGLLSEEDRIELSELGIDLGSGEEALARELSLVYHCVSLPSESLSLSYSAFSESGAKARPSFLITRAKLLFGLREQPVDLNRLRLNAPAPAFLLAAGGGQDAASALALDYFLQNKDTAQRLLALSGLAEGGRGSLSPHAVRSLYGETLSLSPSRADAFSACRFAYFLRYGLRLDEKEKAGFEAPELGSFMHYVLENVAGEIRRGSGFRAVTQEETDALVSRFTEAYIEEKLGGFGDKSPRFVYLFQRLLPSVRRIVSDMVRELSRSDFEPLDFELAFGLPEGLPPVRLSDGERELFIRGIADRVDGYFADGKLYLRVIDYKTGKKSFSYSDVWYGMGMQMLLYLFALEQEGRARYGHEIVPAGVLYVPARDALISASRELSDEELEKEKRKLRQRSGLILDDVAIISAMESAEEPEYLPVSIKKDGSLSSDSLADSEQFSALQAHVNRRLLSLSKALSEGSIAAFPYYRGEQDNACLYCPYAAVCRFDPGKDRRHYLKKLGSAEFWERMEEEK